MSISPWRRNQPQQQQMSQMSPLSDVQRLFDRFFSSGFPFAGFPVGYEASSFPALNVSDAGDAVLVQAEVPGLDADDLDITVEGDMLILKGEKKSEREERQENYYYAERSFGSFIRRVELPSAVDSNKAEARLERGVLTLRLPKSEAAQSRTIKVQGGSQQQLGGQSGNVDVQSGNVGGQQGRMGSQQGQPMGSQSSQDPQSSQAGKRR